LGLDLPQDQCDRLLYFLSLLHEWNRVYNLTTIREPAEGITKHLLDSLTVLPYLLGPRVVDVGTGGGFPGVPLAIVRSDLEFTLIDSSSKKTRFLIHALTQIPLGNVTVARVRSQDLKDRDGYYSVVSRAFASLHTFASRAGHLCRRGGRLVAMKGRLTSAELASLGGEYELKDIFPVHVPGLKAERNIVLITPKRA
jgi:16S rRNA (guanine527-N7)-methyltransferase